MRQIALYRDSLDTAPKSLTVTWAQLADLLTNYTFKAPCTVADGPSKCKGKSCQYKSHSTDPTDYMAWSPVDIKTRRLDKNVQSISWLVLDLDHLTLDQLAHVMAAISRYRTIIHTTHNHRKHDICFRVIIDTTRPVLASEFHEFLRAAVAHLAVPADPTCKNRSRLYYRPSHPADADSFQASAQEGEQLDVDALMRWWRSLGKTGGTDSKSAPLPAEAAWDLESKEVVDLIDAGSRYFPAYRRNEFCLALSGMLRRAGATVDDAEYIVFEIAREGGSDNPQARSKTVAHTYGLTDDSYMTGFTRLSEIIEFEDAKEIGECITRASNNVILKALDSSKATTTEPATTPAATSAVTVVDLSQLREALTSIIAKKSRSQEREDKINAILLRRVKNRERLAMPGGVNDVETVLDGATKGLGRAESLKRVMGTLAFVMPSGTPWSAVAELVRASVGGMEPEPGKNWLAEAERIYETAHGTKRVEELKSKQKEEARRESVKDTFSDGVSPPQPDPEWETKLIKDAAGSVASNTYNVVLHLENHEDFRGQFRWNEITKDVEGVGMWAGIPNLDLLVTRVQDYLIGRFGISTEFNGLARRIVLEARKYSYDPVRTYLTSLKWDGVSRLKTWLETYCSAGSDNEEEIKYIRAIGYRWMIACAARGIQPGCKADTMLILEGKQGIKKSTALRILGGDWFCDTPLDVSNKDSRMLAAISWLVEMPELQSFKTADYLRMKAFLSQQSDKIRPPFGKTVENFARHCAFAGTTNERVYLTDTTGNRRYWSVAISKIDIAALRRDRDQLWAEATHLFLSADSCEECAIGRATSGEDRCRVHRWWLTDDESNIADIESEKREEEVPWLSIIHDWWIGTKPDDRPTEFTTDDVAKNVLEVSLDRITTGLRTQIGVAMHKLQFEKKKMMRDGIRKWFYVPTDKLMNAPYVKKTERVSKGLFSMAGAAAVGKN